MPQDLKLYLKGLKLLWCSNIALFVNQGSCILIRIVDTYMIIIMIMTTEGTMYILYYHESRLLSAHALLDRGKNYQYVLLYLYIFPTHLAKLQYIVVMMASQIEDIILFN